MSTDEQSASFAAWACIIGCTLAGWMSGSILVGLVAALSSIACGVCIQAGENGKRG